MIDYKFKGKVVIVIGGVFGIGLVVVELLVVFGVVVVVWDLKVDVVEKIVEVLCCKDVNVIGIVLDVIDEVVVEVVVYWIVEVLGGLDIVINNVGIGGLLVFSGDYFVDGWKWVIDVNFISVFLC